MGPPTLNYCCAIHATQRDLNDVGHLPKLCLRPVQNGAPNKLEKGQQFTKLSDLPPPHQKAGFPKLPTLHVTVHAQLQCYKLLDNSGHIRHTPCKLL